MLQGAYSRLGFGPRARQRRALQWRESRRCPARLYRRAEPDGRHRGYRDRPADADHQVDPGRYRHCRPDRTVEHRAQGRRSHGAEPARRGRAGRAGRRNHRQPIGGDQPFADGAGHLHARRHGAHATRGIYPGRAWAADADGREREEILRRAGRECRRHRQVPVERVEAVGRAGGRFRQARRHPEGRRGSAELGRPPEDRGHRRQCRDLHRQPQGAERPVRRDRRRRRQGGRIDQRFRREGRADAVQGGRRAGRRRHGKRAHSRCRTSPRPAPAPRRPPPTYPSSQASSARAPRTSTR